MTPLRWLSLAATLGAYAVIVLGGYVSASGFGLACPDWPTCRGSLIPPIDEPGVAVEWSHRLAAVVEGVLVLGLVVLVWWKHRARRDLVGLATGSFVLLLVQTTLGFITVGTELNPAIVTLHLGTAVAFFAIVLLTAVVAWWPPRRTGPHPGPTRDNGPGDDRPPPPTDSM